MKKVYLFFIVFLYGCVNPYNYRNDQVPVAEFSTNKPVQSVAECILIEWQKEPLLSAITQQQTGVYHSILATGDNADIYIENNATKVKYYSLRGSLDIMNGKEKRISGIKSCL